MSQTDLTIIIPALNEENRIGKSLEELAIFLKEDQFFKNKSVEVLVVSADSIDKTHKIVESDIHLFFRNSLTLLKPGSVVGKGRDVQYGVFRAKGGIIVYMDADLATPLQHLEEFYKECLRGCDIVLGTRNLLTYRNNKLKNILSYVGNRLFQLISGIRIEDTQCGFKMFTSDAAKICFSKLTLYNWSFDLELIVIATVNNLKVKKIRIDDWEDKPFSTYNEGSIGMVLRMIKDYAKITIGSIRGKYL